MRATLTMLFLLVSATVSTSSLASRSRQKALESCSKVSRESIRNSHINVNPIALLDFVTWLSGEEGKIFQFTSVVKIRNNERQLFSWAFSSVTRDEPSQCILLKQELLFIQRLNEDDESEPIED